MDLPSKVKSVTAAFYKNVVLKQLKKYPQNLRPSRVWKYIRLLHDNDPAHKALIVTEFLKKENVQVLPNPSFSLDLAPYDYFLFPKLKMLLSDKSYKSLIGSAIYQCLQGIPLQDYENCFKNWIKRLKPCVLDKGEYFEGLRKVK